MEVPASWESPTIGELCDLINGRAFKPTDWTASGLPIVRIQNLKDADAPMNHFDGDVREQFLIDTGQLLFAWSGTPGTSFGAHIWPGGRAVLNQHIFRIQFDERFIDKVFFRYAINQKVEELVGRAHGGVGLAHVTKGVFESTRIGFPPLAEQRRIVAKLDALTARTARARADLDRIPALAARYKQAVLAKAFSGELTADWRRARGQPHDWAATTLGSISTVSGGKRLPAGHDYANCITETAYIRVSNFAQGYIDPKDIRYLEPSTADVLSRYRVRPGDLCISIAGTIGQVVSVSEALAGSVLTENAARIRLAEGIDETFVRHLLSSPQARDQIVEKTVATAVAKLALFRIEQIELELPPYPEQVEIVGRIERAFSEIDRLVAEAAAARRLLDRLDQAVLAKAFRGDLVPQDPADEPASVLLDRIRAERAAAPKAKRGRKAALA